MDLFTRGEIDRVELIYHHYRSTRSQVLKQETLSPIDLSELEEAAEKNISHLDYILEPDKQQPTGTTGSQNDPAQAAYGSR
jgi:F-type H+-transporting ATPase subunit gamma